MTCGPQSDATDCLAWAGAGKCGDAGTPVSCPPQADPFTSEALFRRRPSASSGHGRERVIDVRQAGDADPRNSRQYA